MIPWRCMIHNERVAILQGTFWHQEHFREHDEWTISGFVHWAARPVTGGSLNFLDHKAFNGVNTMIGNVKNSLWGSCHTLGAKHLPRHLAEYCFRFNHRFELKRMITQLGRAVVASPPMPCRLLKMAEGHGQSGCRKGTNIVRAQRPRSGSTTRLAGPQFWHAMWQFKYLYKSATYRYMDGV